MACLIYKKRKAQTPIIRFSGLPQPLLSYDGIHACSVIPIDNSPYCSFASLLWKFEKRLSK